MLHIDYMISMDERAKLLAAAPASLSSDKLRYYYTWGTIKLACDGIGGRTVTFQAPVLDFVLSLRYIIRELEPGRKDVLEFTESESGLIIRRDGDIINMTANFSDWTCSSPWTQVDTMARDLWTHLVSDLCETSPALAENPVIRNAQE